jgi:4-amino-4-deoxy-L-arabinose transferase-like glycosyltransferase
VEPQLSVNLAGMKMRLYLLLALSALVFGANSWGTSVYILDEAKNASCAMEMWQRSDVVVPTFNSNLRTDKPPLHYYFMMLGYSLFGISPFSARLFSVLAGVVMVGFMYRKVSRWINEQAAFYSTLMLIASLHMTVQFHLAVPDPYLLLWITVCLISLYELLQNKPRAAYFFYISAALGFLTKGLIAVVFPTLIGLVYLLIKRYPFKDAWSKLKPLSGALIFSALALPWYVAVGIETNGEWLHGFFLQHHLSRYTATMEGHRGFFLAPIIFLLMALFPFSGFSIGAFASAWANRKATDFALFAGVAVTVVVVFFAFSKTLLPGYVGPAVPFFAVILGNYFAHFVMPGKTAFYIVGSITLLTALAFPIGGHLLLTNGDFGPPLNYLGAVLVVVPVSVLWGLRYLGKNQVMRAFIAWCAGMLIVSQLFFYGINPALDKLNPVVDSRPIREKFVGYQPVTYGLFNPAFVFEYKKPLPALNPSLYSSQPIMIITRSNYLEEISSNYTVELVYRKTDLFEKSETVILVSSGAHSAF